MIDLYSGLINFLTVTKIGAYLQFFHLDLFAMIMLVAVLPFIVRRGKQCFMLRFNRFFTRTEPAHGNPDKQSFLETELARDFMPPNARSVYPLKLITIQAQGTKSSNKDNLIAQLKIAIEHLEAGTGSGSNNIDQCGFAFSYEDHLHRSIFTVESAQNA